jgi:hypothetical protein
MPTIFKLIELDRGRDRPAAPVDVADALKKQWIAGV